MLSRTAINALRRAAPKASSLSRGFAAAAVTHNSKGTTTAATPAPAEISLGAIDPCLKPLSEINSADDLLPPGAPAGSVPTDYNQSTGLERLEILGKIQGVDIFDMRPLDASRLGTLADPIVIGSYGEERYLGCTGFPSDSHNVIWLTTSRTRPLERCPECGSVYRMEYLGKVPDEHAHGGHGGEEEGHHHGYVEPKTFADFIRPEYTGR